MTPGTRYCPHKVSACEELHCAHQRAQSGGVPAGSAEAAVKGLRGACDASQQEQRRIQSIFHVEASSWLYYSSTMNGFMSLFAWYGAVRKKNRTQPWVEAKWLIINEMCTQKMVAA